MSKKASYMERFFQKVDQSNDCWVWTASLSKGYGRFWYEKKLVQAHRWLYEQERGEVDPSLHIDHLCRNRACVRPSHMEPVTQRENLRRGKTTIVARADALECVNSHEFTHENTHIRKNGTRACRMCHKLRERKRRATQNQR